MTKGWIWETVSKKLKESGIVEEIMDKAITEIKKSGAVEQAVGKAKGGILKFLTSSLDDLEKNARDLQEKSEESLKKSQEYRNQRRR